MSQHSPPSFTCPHYGHQNHHAYAVAHQYCGQCPQFSGDPGRLFAQWLPSHARAARALATFIAASRLAC